jgi:hypothetical protein
MERARNRPSTPGHPEAGGHEIANDPSWYETLPGACDTIACAAGLSPPPGGDRQAAERSATSRARPLWIPRPVSRHAAGCGAKCEVSKGHAPGGYLQRRLRHLRRSSIRRCCRAGPPSCTRRRTPGCGDPAFGQGRGYRVRLAALSLPPVSLLRSSLPTWTSLASSEALASLRGRTATRRAGLRSQQLQ